MLTWPEVVLANGIFAAGAVMEDTSTVSVQPQRLQVMRHGSWVCINHKQLNMHAQSELKMVEPLKFEDEPSLGPQGSFLFAS